MIELHLTVHGASRAEALKHLDALRDKLTSAPLSPARTYIQFPDSGPPSATGSIRLITRDLNFIDDAGMNSHTLNWIMTHPDQVEHVHVDMHAAGGNFTAQIGGKAFHARFVAPKRARQVETSLKRRGVRLTYPQARPLPFGRS